MNPNLRVFQALICTLSILGMIPGTQAAQATNRPPSQISTTQPKLDPLAKVIGFFRIFENDKIVSLVGVAQNKALCEISVSLEGKDIIVDFHQASRHSQINVISESSYINGKRHKESDVTYSTQVKLSEESLELITTKTFDEPLTYRSWSNGTDEVLVVKSTRIELSAEKSASAGTIQAELKLIYEGTDSDDKPRTHIEDSCSTLVRYSFERTGPARFVLDQWGLKPLELK